MKWIIVCIFALLICANLCDGKAFNCRSKNKRVKSATKQPEMSTISANTFTGSPFVPVINHKDILLLRFPLIGQLTYFQLFLSFSTAS